MKIKAIIFDIGGVILEDPMFGEFWQGKEESKALRQAFGTGKMTMKKKNNNIFIILGALGGIVLLIIIISVAYLMWQESRTCWIDTPTSGFSSIGNGEIIEDENQTITCKNGKLEFEYK